MKKIAFSLLWLLCGLFSGLWAENIEKTVTSIVPDSAIMVLTVENPGEVLSQWDNFLKPLTVLQGKSLAQMIDDWEKQSGFPFSQLDWSSPWVVGVSQNQSSYDGILAVALKNKDKALAGFKKAFASGTMKFSSFNNYGILVPALSSLPKLPQKKGFDLANLKAVTSEGVTLYMKLTNFSINGQPFSEVIRSGLEEQTESVVVQKAAVKRLMDDFLKLWDEGINLGTTLVVDGKNIKSFFWTDLKANGVANKALKNLTPVSGSKEFYRYIDPHALVSGVVNFDPVVAWNIEQYFDDLYKRDVPGYEAYKKLLKSRAELLGKRSAFNVDLLFDAEKIKALSKQTMDTPTEKNIADILDCFDLRFFGVCEVKDEKAFRKHESLLFSEAGIQNVVNGMFKQFNAPLEVTFDYKSNLKSGNLEYDQIHINVKVSEGEMGATSINKKTAQGMNMIFKQFFDQNPLYYSFSSGKLYYYLGKQGLERIKEYVKKDGLPVSWKTDSTVASWQATMPDDAVLTCGVSLAKLFQFFKEANLDAGKGMPQISDSLNLAFYGKVRSSGNLEVGVVTPQSDVQAIVNFAMLLKARPTPHPKAAAPLGGRKTPPEE